MRDSRSVLQSSVQKQVCNWDRGDLELGVWLSVFALLLAALYPATTAGYVVWI